MSARATLTRRGLVGGLGLLALPRLARAQGFAGLSDNADGFAPVTPGKAFSFPADHGPHDDFRIEWWYVTANLTDGSGTAYGLQWTLFRSAARPGPQGEGFDNQQLWMAHAAVTRAESHRSTEKYARGGVGQAGVEAKPFQAWIDGWQLRGTDATDDQSLAPLDMSATASDFSYALHLEADHPMVLQGINGYSRKSERGQASYYYSQPFYRARGRISFDDQPVEVTGMAWLDREWSSQPLASDQSGWDWFALHFSGGEKLMLYRMRQGDGNYTSGTWITADGTSRPLGPEGIVMTPKETVAIGERKLPVSWHIEISALGIAIDSAPLNPRAWMGTRVPYWEGPISFKGSHTGVGYLELTGY
ncbi:signal peptide [Bradyrhizobium oligotrophicum S58]|uniref:Signal peptide n=1 Tax=Bradyrhizobium oligotrophicum S58 TaxID=1245469 RepID=M4ZK60_9BRAD|nr:lipocalin-like domain-containing protein [Bradyrhizobium oligotrophicum]BAM86625.1 signal peptide [Bradyrhizobium oligotrophicum S58]